MNRRTDHGRTWLQRTIKRWRYITITSRGVLCVDPRWYFESENGQRQIKALKGFC